MRKIQFIPILLVPVIIACTKLDLTSTKVIAFEEVVPEVPELVPEFYVSGLEFDPDYDWRLDRDYGFARCSMFMESDRERLMSFDVGYEKQISSDDDMTRCIGSHIYTDFSTDDETVIKRDGVELFRYPGREMIAGMTVRDDGIYTLGVPREGGKGWNYRRNGISIVEASEGEVVRGLYDDAGDNVFTYTVHPYGYYDSSPSCFVVRNGVSHQLTVPSGFTLIDYAYSSGAVSMLLKKDSADRLFFLSTNGLLSAITAGNVKIYDVISLEMSEDGPFVRVKVLLSGRVGYAVWKDGVLSAVFNQNLTPEHVYMSQGEVLAVCRQNGEGAKKLYYDGEYTELPEGYTLSSRACGAFVQGHYCVCFSPELPGPGPFFIIDGTRKDIEINGWLAGVGYELPDLGASSDGLDDDSEPPA